mgnify:FL=1
MLFRSHDGHGNYYDDEGNKFHSKPRSSFGRRHIITSREPDHPHSVHINGKKWKTFGSYSHASNVAKKIKGATVHKEETEIEEVEQIEQINELSSELLAHYKKNASLAAQAADKAKKYDLGHKRFKGIMKATFKQFANDAKK